MYSLIVEIKIPNEEMSAIFIKAFLNTHFKKYFILSTIQKNTMIQIYQTKKIYYLRVNISNCKTHVNITVPIFI